MASCVFVPLTSCDDFIIFIAKIYTGFHLKSAFIILNIWNGHIFFKDALATLHTLLVVLSIYV